MPDDEIMTSEKLAEKLKMSVRQVQDLALQPGCPAYDVGCSDRMALRWPYQATLQWLHERKEKKRQERVQMPPPDVDPDFYAELHKRKRGRPRKTPDQVLAELRMMRVIGGR